MKPLNSKRLRLLHIVATSQQRGTFPLVRELAQELGYRGESSITRMLDALVDEGYLMKHGGGQERRHRIYTLTPQSQSLLSNSASRPSVPVLGSIPAGPLAEAVQECGEFIDPGDFLRVQGDDFFLRVSGESMTGDGILPGDLVLIRPGMQVSNGEIAAVQIHSARQSDATLKHIYWQPGKQLVRLRASNPAYGEVVLQACEVAVIGAYRGLLRRSD